MVLCIIGIQADIDYLLLLVAVMAGYFKHKIVPSLAPAGAIDGSRAVAVIALRAPLTEPVPASIEANPGSAQQALAEAERRSVHPGEAAENGLVEIIDGLREGEQILPLPTQVK